MTKNTLGILLAAQLVLVLVVWGFGREETESPEAFLSFDPAAVDTLFISDGEISVELTRSGKEWIFGDDFPASKTKIDGVLEKLGNTSAGWPVGTTSSAAERFEVTDEQFQRHLVAKAGEATIADVYLGSSPSFRKVHARHANGGPVYAINFSNYEVGAKASDWLNKGLFRPEGNIESLERKGHFIAIKENGIWSSAVEDLDQSEVNKLASRFSGLSVTEPSDLPLPSEPWIQYHLGDDEGNQILSIYRVDDENNYVITSDRTVGVYGISSFVAEQFDIQLGNLKSADGTETAEDEAADIKEET